MTLIIMASGGESTGSCLPPMYQSQSTLTHISKGLVSLLEVLLLGGHV